MNQKQVAALKYLIYKSKDASELSKQVMVYLINQSMGFTKEVAISFLGGMYGYSDKEARGIVYGVHGMQSSNGSTHLDAMMKLANCNLNFSHHQGCYENETFNSGKSVSGTVWLSNHPYGHKTKKLIVLPTPEKRIIQKINLEKNGLYR
jgi:hypothetical protein